MASADIPEELWTTAFKPEVVRERMRWVMEYDLLKELSTRLQASEDAADASELADGSGPPTTVKVVC